MYWANFLHMYQPPTQKPEWVRRITAESYRKIFKGLLDAPHVKVTLNVNGILLEHFDACGEQDVIAMMRQLLVDGKLELTGSAKYHPLLPFLPPHEVRRQVRLNEETHRKYFGDLYRPKGFFPPEMGFSMDVARMVKELGYQWIIADELSFPRGRAMDHTVVYTVRGLGDFQIYFRERRTSWVILSGQIGTGNLLIESLGDRVPRNEYLLTAMDGETFGHHRPGLEGLLFEIYRSQRLTPALISELPSLFSAREEIDPLPSTWALMEKDLERNKPFSRWKDDDNEIQRMQWELTDLAIKTVGVARPSDPGYEEVRDALDRALHSDQYWWASARPWWSIEMIERGAKELAGAVQKTPGASVSAKERARELYRAIIDTAFDWQRVGKVESLAAAEDEDIRQRTDQGIPKLPKAEIEKMVAQLVEEMRLLAGREEFERAAHIRDRIAELRGYEAREDTSELVG